MKLTLLFIVVAITACRTKPEPQKTHHGYLWEQATPHDTESNMLHVIRLEYWDEPVRN